MKALFFDVFGTLVDFRTSVAREAEALLGPLGIDIEWLAFADAWRGEYQAALEAVRSGSIPFCRLDVLHRRNLERILPRFGISNLSEDVARELNLAWHRLDAWPDVPPALRRLRRRFLLAPVSNGNISLMLDLARRNEFPWDGNLGAEVARDYKPKPRAYLAACEDFDLEPEHCVMVAAHTNDLLAAAQCGLRTAHVARPNEARTRSRRGSADGAPSISPSPTSAHWPTSSAPDYATRRDRIPAETESRNPLGR